MVCGMGIVALTYIRVRMSLGRVLLGIAVFGSVETALNWSVFQTENALSTRIDAKWNARGDDRVDYWAAGVEAIRKTPLGEGWSSRAHSDWLNVLLSYGWPTGVMYIAAVGSLFFFAWKSLRRAGTSETESRILPLVALAAISVYAVNSVFDMPSANSGYYETVWALILTPAAVLAVTGGAKRTTASLGFRPPSTGQQWRRV